MNATAKIVDLHSSAKEIIDEVGDLSGIEVMYNQILVGIYKRPERSAGGIIYTDTAKKEDEYQGKVALVLKVGPTAFKSDEDMDFGDQSVAVGDWIVLRPGDGWQLRVGKRACRMLVDSTVKMKIAQPDLIY